MTKLLAIGLIRVLTFIVPDNKQSAYTLIQAREEARNQYARTTCTEAINVPQCRYIARIEWNVKHPIIPGTSSGNYFETGCNLIKDAEALEQIGECHRKYY